MSSWYPAGTPDSVQWADWFPFLAHHRVPADSIYLGGPRPTAEYVELAATGAKWMGMGDAGREFPSPGYPISALPAYVDSWIEKLTPTMANLSALGLLDKSYVPTPAMNMSCGPRNFPLILGLLMTYLLAGAGLRI